MKNKIIDILKSFSADEIRRFKIYLASPYFNRSRKIQRLYAEIINFSPFYNSDEFNYKNLHFKVSPHIPYNSVTMRRLLADLEKYALDFLRQINLDKDEISTHNYLRDELQSRSLSKLFENSVNEFEEKFGSENYIDERYFINKLNLETDKLNYSYISKNLSKKLNVNSLILYLVTASKYLFLYFTMKMVSYYLNLQTMQTNYKDTEERDSLYKFLVKFFDGIDNFYLKEFLKDKVNDYYYVYDIYFNLFKAFSGKMDLRYYNKCKKLLTANAKYFRTSEKNMLFGTLIDFCELRQRVNPEDEFSKKELFRLYDLFLSKKYYESENTSHLPIPLFRNIMNFAIRNKKYAWAEKFIKIYSNRLYPDFKNDLKNLGFARIAFNRGQFTDTLRYMSKVNPEAPNAKLDYKNLNIMVHYELGNFETVRNAIESYKLFIRRSGVVSKENKVYYRNFIHYTGKLINFINNRNKTYFESLTDSIKTANKLVYKAWLLNKANALASMKTKAA
jgi:hypothetical protein